MNSRTNASSEYEKQHLIKYKIYKQSIVLFTICFDDQIIFENIMWNWEVNISVFLSQGLI